MESWLRRNALRITVLAVAALLAFVGVVLASGSGSVQICISSKEGKPIVTPKGGACKTGYTLTEVNKEGPAGKEGAVGKEGAQGKEGPFPSTLPHGDTVTGAWGVTNGSGSGSGSDWGTSAISFPYRLASAPTGKFIQRGKTETGCTGTASNPTAESGYLCVYEGISLEVNLGVTPFLCSPVNGCKEGPSTVGAEVRLFGTSGSTRWYDWGTWAVTG